MSLDLIIHLLVHLLASVIAGYIIWKLWQKPIASFLSAIVGGIFVDLDHFIDYFLAFGFDFRWSYFFDGLQFAKSGKDYVFFHGWEYVAVFVILIFLFKTKSAKSIFLGLALGLFFHLALDVALNDLPIKSYSIIQRVGNNFEAEKLIKPERRGEYLIKKQIIKF